MTAATIDVNVRYFAAARAAAGVETETVSVGAGHDGRPTFSPPCGRAAPKLAAVLDRCSFLCDGVAVRDAA